jgi:hypothetical protein
MEARRDHAAQQRTSDSSPLQRVDQASRQAGETATALIGAGRMAEKVEKDLGPPHSLHAEQAILGTLLHDNDAYYKVSDYLKPEHFFHPQHRKVFG